MADEAMKARLEDRGFEVVEEDLHVPIRDVDSVVVDYRLKRDDQFFLALVRQASTPRGFVQSGFPRAHMKLEAARRQEPYGDDVPLIVLRTDEFSVSGMNSIGFQKSKYAPDYEYVVLVGEDLNCMLDSAEGRMMVPEKDSPSSEDHSLAFSDLELWLTKFLLYQMDPPEGWPHDSQLVRNPNQLSEQADVSPDKAYTFIRAMKAQGFIKETDLDSLGLEIADQDELLAEWREHYRLRHQKFIRGYKLGREDDNPVDAIRQRLEGLEKEDREQCIITGVAADAIQGDVSGDQVQTAHVFCLDPGLDLLKGESFQEPEEPEDLEVVFWYPILEESVKRGAIMTDEGVKISDPIQRKLDQPKLDDGESWRHYNWKKIERA